MAPLPAPQGEACLCGAHRKNRPSPSLLPSVLPAPWLFLQGSWDSGACRIILGHFQAPRGPWLPGTITVVRQKGGRNQGHFKPTDPGQPPGPLDCDDSGSSEVPNQAHSPCSQACCLGVTVRQLRSTGELCPLCPVTLGPSLPPPSAGNLLASPWPWGQPLTRGGKRDARESLCLHPTRSFPKGCALLTILQEQ